MKLCCCCMLFDNKYMTKNARIDMSVSRNKTASYYSELDIDYELLTNIKKRRFT